MKGTAETNSFRPTVARIDLAALRHNYQLARDLSGPDISLTPVVKANAYGHGAVPVARELEKVGVAGFAVASPEEGMELRLGGIRAPVYVFGGPFRAPAKFFLEHRLIPVLYNREQAEWLARDLTGPLEVHLKVDTGMTRLGVLPAELPSFLSFLAQFPNLHLSAVLTHLAQADVTFEGPTDAQYRRFAELEKEINVLAPGVKIFHIANSAAILGKRLGKTQWARPGIMLYGSNPNPRFEAAKQLQPVMSFETEIVSLKTVPPGTAISYGGEWVAKRPSRIAVIPVGYADGYIRHLGNAGEVLIRGRKFPVVGRVCMDLTMLDVTELDDPQINEKVLLWGPGLPAETVAANAGTISYELFCAVSRRVPRVYGGVTA